MISVARCGGKVVYQSVSIKDKLTEQIEEAEKQINELNRKARRSKQVKVASSVLAFLGTLAVASVAKAASIDPTGGDIPQDPGSISQGHETWQDWLLTKLFKIAPNLPTSHNFQFHHVEKSDTLVWQVAKYLTDTMFTTVNPFNNAHIVSAFNSIGWLSMSFVTIIVAKKGFDIIKSKIIGGTTVGVGEMSIRLLLTLVVNLLSLSVIKAGIQFSNATIGKMMDLLSHGFWDFYGFVGGAQMAAGHIFWLAAFVVLFSVLAVRFWLRNINLMLLGVMSPIAALAQVNDGGAMLKSLFKEIGIHLTTPIVQAATLALGNIMMYEVAPVEHYGFLSSVFIGIATFFLMLTTPEFLRKFATGSANPFKFAADTFVKLKAMPNNMMNLLKM